MSIHFKHYMCNKGFFHMKHSKIMLVYIICKGGKFKAKGNKQSEFFLGGIRLFHLFILYICAFYHCQVLLRN